MQGHVITPIHKKEKKPEPQGIPSIADLLAVSQPMTNQETHSRRPAQARPPQPLGQPVKKINVPRAAETASTSNSIPQDFLADLLPGLNLGPPLNEVYISLKK